MAFQKTAGFALYYMTTPNRAEARRLSKALLDEELVACTNILPGMESHYRWQGKREQARECVLLLKAPRRQAKKILAFIRARHSYECPCFLELPITGGFADYLRWMKNESRR